MTRKSPLAKFSYFVIVLLLLLVTRAQSVNKTVDDSYIHNSYQPNGANSYLDGIQYHPAWTHRDGDSNRFNNTYSSSTNPRTNLIHFFQGNTIYYYGETGGSDHAPAIVYLDGERVVVPTNTSASSVRYQQLLWNKTDVGQGDHQIVINNGGQSSQVVGLDYFVIESDRGFIPSRAGPASSSIPPGAIIVDDDNSDHITYTGWETQTYQSGNFAFFYNNTVHRTTVPGSYATFKFTGTAVWYITDTFSTHAQVNITFNGAFNGIANSYSDQQLSQRIIWQATDLKYGEHTVIVTHQDGRPVRYATLDYFMYFPGEPLQKSSLPAGAIAGGVIGGISLISMCVAGYMLVRRRRRTGRRSDIDLDGYDGPPLLNNDDGSQPVAHQPAWGYVATSHVPQQNQNSGASPGHGHEHRPPKGQNLVQSPATETVALSSTIISSTDESTVENHRDEPGFRDRDSNLSPPPYM